MSLAFFWFRRDLRLHDNAGLYRALTSGYKVLPVFIFDQQILDKLDNRADSRVAFIFETIAALKADLEARGSTLLVRYGQPEEVWADLLTEYAASAIYTNTDYEPYAKARDTAIQALAEKHKVAFHAFKDHVIFHKDEVVKDDGTPYVVFTPYKRVWLRTLDTRPDTDTDGNPVSYYLKPYPTEKYLDELANHAPTTMPTLAEMNFTSGPYAIPADTVNRGLIRRYDETRDYPAVQGTSRLGIHFRFGTISIREKARKALALNDTFLSELIWRDFYAMILDHFPHVAERSFREKYDQIDWRNNETEFRAWCAGQTGYHIVDAGMRELNQTGYMHNRVRMIAASFLTKHLLIDWRWGEAYFAEKLLDFDLASNNGGWQWAAGCGTDAAPYFRVFNPDSQQKKFDKDFTYIKQWVPEYGTDKYVARIVDHKAARERCLRVYKEGLSDGSA